jgi:phage-related holin
MKIFPLPEFMMKIVAMLFLFLTPIKEVMLAVAFLIIADAITGIWAAKKKGEKFSSNKFFDSIVKLIFYLVLIMISRMTELYLISHLPLVQLSIYFIVFYEFSSFLENVGVITGRDIFSWFKTTLSSLKSNSRKK